MRTSQYLLSTNKETPTNVKIISHQLMLRAGMIKQLSSGLYTWLPTGLRVLHKLQNIIRTKMNNIGALEISMPIMQPAHLWKDSQRWIEYGPELLKLNDRNQRSFVLGPTHEEVITNIMRNELNSYKQLPINFYQIQTKFRDELRSRSGVMRSREFIMKDAYSFHIDQESLQNTCDLICQVYKSIFDLIKLDFYMVQADTGSFGGSLSYEFQVLSDNGEDEIVFSTKSNYSTNIDLAERIIPYIPHTITKPNEIMRLVEVPNVNSINKLVNLLNLSLKKTIKILIVHASKKINCPLIALILRGDHTLNKIKAEKLPQVLTPLTFASTEEIKLLTGVKLNILGPINLSLPLIIDYSVALMHDFIACANAENKYFFGINWQRDLPLPEIADLRKVVNGDLSPDGHGILEVKRGIEIGHIFQLGSKYADVLNAKIRNHQGIVQPLIMGCYGIGITRAIAAIIEQNHDIRGILWPDDLAPFNIAIIPINMHASSYVNQISEKIYRQLSTYNIDVLFDDRKEHPGVMFNDMDLIGIPHNIIISKYNLESNFIEYKHRYNGEKKMIKLNEITEYVIKKLNK